MQNEPTRLILPRNYLSWSQLSCWQFNQTRYRKEYFENSEKLDSPYLRFGKKIALMIEKGEHKELIPDLILYDTPEFEIKTIINDIPTLSYLDSYNSKTNNFIEIKTGIVPWTESRVIKHGQLLFYATALKASTGKMPEYCDLFWLETKETSIEVNDFWRDNEKELNLTGKIKMFHREFDSREIERMEKLIVKIANEISIAYQLFIKEI